MKVSGKIKKKGIVSAYKCLRRRKGLRTIDQSRSCFRSSRDISFIDREAQAEYGALKQRS